MAMTDRIKGFLQTPRAKNLMERGRRQMGTPATQQKLRQLTERVRGKTGPRR